MKLPSKNRSIHLASNATPELVALTMVEVIRACSKETYVQDIAREVQKQSANILQGLANYAYKNVYFLADPPTDQIIRTPAASLREGFGNCVDYTVLIGSMAKAINLPIVVCIVQLPGQTNFGHVYPIVNGVTIDVVPGQDQNGREIFDRLPGKIPILNKTLLHLDSMKFTV
jgi:transglutaminase-like putative cysteine protease